MNTQSSTQRSLSESPREAEQKITKRGILGLPSGESRPRVLYLILAYPTFSETYMHEEIRSMSRDYEICIITCRNSSRPRKVAYEHYLIPYRSTCLQYGRFDKVNLSFSDAEQQEFLQAVDIVISSFKPDLIHCHYLGMGVLASYLASKYSIPFTVRSHSMDILNEPTSKLDAYCSALGSSGWCQAVLTFPRFVPDLIKHGVRPSQIKPCWPVINHKLFHSPLRRERTCRIICAGPAIRKKAHDEFLYLAKNMRDTSYVFDLYAEGPSMPEIRRLNDSLDNPVNIRYADPDDMPAIWIQYDWLVYPSDPRLNKVGLPCGICEAMAAGLGYIWRELPGRRDEQLEFMGGSGYLYSTLEEAREILSQPYPEDKRIAGIDISRRYDIEAHRQVLVDAWGAGLDRRQPSLG